MKPSRLSTTALAAVGALLASASAANAAPVTAYQMPFPCGQSWTGTTRYSHSPSPNAIDWNRTDDVGDPVVAAAAGVVTTAVPYGTRGYGHYVVIDHGNGESTLYAHLQSVNVGLGQTVDQGSLIGLLGNTGNSTGPHLHFEQRLNGHDVEPWSSGTAFDFGTTQRSQNCPNVPLAGNFAGDRRAEVAVYERTTRTFKINALAGPVAITFGRPTDSPVVGDWDGDGVLNVGVRRASNRTFYLSTPSGTVTIVMGNHSDIPVAGDWDGDGTWEPGVRKASSNVFRLRKPDGTSIAVQLGKASDIPVTGDWNGDGVTDLGVYDLTKARFSLRIEDVNGLVWITRVAYGTPGDLPVTGDWDGNGRTDLGVWHPSTAQFSQRIAPSPTATVTRSITQVYGSARD